MAIAEESSLVVRTESGIVEGIESTDGKYRIFRGVPYAQPPVGNLRFHRPVPKSPWQGVRPCKAFPPKAFQGDLTKDSFYGKEFYAGPDVPMSEDCLYLNLWAPAAGKKHPVLLWIHGGAFLHGFGSEIEFDGAEFARQGVILVTVNYRVGALGFFAHETLEAEAPEKISGNYGLWDQVAALRWVHDNIAAFGGDPDRVTIAGQSAGCMSVQCLISSPLTKELFSGAILQSGGGLPGLGNDYSAERVKEASRKLMEKLGVSTIAALRDLSPETIASMQYELMNDMGGLCWTPIIDGCFLPDTLENLAKSGQIHDIAYMIGSTKGDMGSDTAGLLQKSAVGWAENQAALGRRAPYVYYFTRELPGDLAGAYHSCELWYEFATLTRCWRPFTQEDYVLSQILSCHFAAFVLRGDPNAEGLPLWKPYTPESPWRMIYNIAPAQERYQS